MKWSWRGKTIEVGVEIPRGRPRSPYASGAQFDFDPLQMRPLAEQLVSAFTTIAIDWPGFGDRPRPAIAWEAGMPIGNFLNTSCKNCQNALLAFALCRAKFQSVVSFLILGQSLGRTAALGSIRLTQTGSLLTGHMSAIGGKADLAFCTANVRLLTQSGHGGEVGFSPFQTGGLSQCAMSQFFVAAIE